MLEADDDARGEDGPALSGSLPLPGIEHLPLRPKFEGGNIGKVLI